MDEFSLVGVMIHGVKIPDFCYLFDPLYVASIFQSCCIVRDDSSHSSEQERQRDSKN